MKEGWRNMIIMIVMDMECFEEVEFKYRVWFANNFSRLKVFSAIFSNGGFVGFLISNSDFMLM